MPAAAVAAALAVATPQARSEGQHRHQPQGQGAKAWGVVVVRLTASLLRSKSVGVGMEGPRALLGVAARQGVVNGLHMAA